MNIERKIIESNRSCATHRKMIPSSVTIHWVGPYPWQKPEDIITWWIRPGGEASAHFIIKDDRCVQCWELDDVAWHCGNPAGNLSSIGIEVVPEDSIGKFSDKSIQTLKELIQYLRQHVPVKEIKRHYDWSKKDCPRYYTPEAQDKNGNECWKELLTRLI